MTTRQIRTLGLAAGLVLLVWLLAWGGVMLARNSRMTSDKFRAYAGGVDLSLLRGKDRELALQELARRLNALSAEDRRESRRRRDWDKLFLQMTDAEKEAFIEATFPAGVKQMITSFEKLPEGKRKKTIEDALRRLRDDAAQNGTDNPPGDTAQTERGVSPELEARIRTLGLKTFYAESSAQTKAEAAPLLEEIQRLLESGGRPGPR